MTLVFNAAPASRQKLDLRCRVIAADGRRSTTWRIFGTAKTSDVYILAKPLGGRVKVSLHESGDLRHAFISDDVADLPLGAPRAFEKFTWPTDEIAPGWIIAYAVGHPESELRRYPDESKPAEDLPSGNPGELVIVLILMSKPDTKSIESESWTEITETTLPSGSQVKIVRFAAPVTDKMRDEIERTRAAALEDATSKAIDLDTKHPVTVLMLETDDGGRWCVEVAAWNPPALHGHL